MDNRLIALAACDTVAKIPTQSAKVLIDAINDNVAPSN